MSRARWLVAVLTALAVLASACSGSVARPAATAGPGETAPFKKTALWIEREGQAQPFDNGSSVVVGDVNVEVFIAPYPPQREGSIDLYITERTTGKPVETGSVDMAFDMYMPHGRIRAEAQPVGGGHYLVPYKLVMPGEWRLDMTVSRSGEIAALAFIFRTD